MYKSNLKQNTKKNANKKIAVTVLVTLDKKSTIYILVEGLGIAKSRRMSGADPGFGVGGGTKFAKVF